MQKVEVQSVSQDNGEPFGRKRQTGNAWKLQVYVHELKDGWWRDFNQPAESSVVNSRSHPNQWHRSDLRFYQWLVTHSVIFRSYMAREWWSRDEKHRWIWFGACLEAREVCVGVWGKGPRVKSNISYKSLMVQWAGYDSSVISTKYMESEDLKVMLRLFLQSEIISNFYGSSSIKIQIPTRIAGWPLLIYANVKLSD